MKIPHAALPNIRSAVVISFVALCGLFFGYLWINMGGTIPAVSSKGYRVSLQLSDADNLVYDSDVMVAGVRVGKVRELESEGGKARVVVQLDDDAVVPLHEGAVIRVRSKSLIEETYLEIEDGAGEEIPDDGTLPASAVRPSVQLDEVLASLDAPTRKSLQGAVQALGDGTRGTRDDLARTMSGLGMLGREGHTVLDALAAQSQDLRAMLRESKTLVRALDSGRGQIVGLVDSADRLTSATAGSSRDLEATMRSLPGLLDNARTATGSLSVLSAKLSPVTRDLATAARPLDTALLQLPAVTRDLRGLLPSLDGTLRRAPRTLDAVPGAADELRELVPTLRLDLAELNPMLAYLRPYGHDLGAFFANWTAMLAYKDGNGHYLRILPVANEGSLKNMPLSLNHGILDKSNAYPEPGGATNPGPFDGTYEHVERDEP
jgi:phospholipid/cholesterol/gamma-HCH transport system substrate-binding protein